MIAGKIWGQTELLLTNPTLELHKIDFNGGMECSMHCHKHKYNAFYCLEGQMEIHVEKSGYDLTDVTILYPGDLCVVPPGEFHKFVGIETGSALELYWAAHLDIDDIIRKNVGGSVNGGKEKT